jgi:hypothetical protein
MEVVSAERSCGIEKRRREQVANDEGEEEERRIWRKKPADPGSGG